MLSVVVLSSDGYSDCWEPVFMSFKKYFEGIETYEVILSTNVKSYTHPGLTIKTVNHGAEMPWSKRLKNTLKHTKNDLVLVLVEDFFLRSTIPLGDTEHLIKLMQTEDIDHIRLINSGGKFKTNLTDIPMVEEIQPTTNHRFLYLPGMWKKSVLEKYIVDHEMPYMAEKMANVRARFFKDKFYAVSQAYIKKHGQFYHSSSSGAIYKGKWVSWVAQYFQENQIEIDLSIRGVGDPNFNKSMRNKTLIGLAKQPKPTLKSLWSIASLYVHTRIKSTKHK